jgi:hypothetical protein
MSAREISKLRRIIKIAEQLIALNPKPRRGRPPSLVKGEAKSRSGSKRVRRTGSELVQFRRMLKSERKRGVSVSELARKHGISSAYIYMLP